MISFSSLVGVISESVSEQPDQRGRTSFVSSITLPKRLYEAVIDLI
jgi:hypothetical protein